MAELAGSPASDHQRNLADPGKAFHFTGVDEEDLPTWLSFDHLKNPKTTPPIRPTMLPTKQIPKIQKPPPGKSLEAKSRRSTASSRMTPIASSTSEPKAPARRPAVTVPINFSSRNVVHVGDLPRRRTWSFPSRITVASNHGLVLDTAVPIAIHWHPIVYGICFAPSSD